MIDHAKPVSRPWRRFLRFSVRGLVVLVLLIGVGLGWLVNSARTQREAVAEIREVSGIVEYDWEWHNGNRIPHGKPWAPGWLVDLMGVDYFGHVTAVELKDFSTPTDATIAQVGHLARLQQLIVFAPTLTEFSLAHLSRLSNLTSLNLYGTRITDAGMAHLKRRTSLRELYLASTKISDAGLVHLSKLSNLTDLYLCNTQITGAGLATEGAEKPLRPQSQRHSRLR